MSSHYLLCFNAGSSSLKFKVFDLGQDVKRATGDDLKEAAAGSAKPKEGGKITLSLSAKGKSGKASEHEVETGLTSPEAVKKILSVLASDFDIPSDQISHISHRVVHGAHLANCIEIPSQEAESFKSIEFLTSFAPLHNASATSMIKSTLDILPKATNYGCFDTAFHVASMDAVRYRYPVREDAAGRGLPGGMSLRKWGFHGLSYSSVTRSVAAEMGKDASSLNLIICHLGSGASICAIKGGRSFDTSMGLTPLEGLPGSSRSGSIDPTLSHHILPPEDSKAEPTHQDSTGEQKLKVKIGDAEVDWAEYTLNTSSGFKALADTGDFAEIVEKRGEDDKCKLAFDVFVDRIIGFVGSYAFKLAPYGGVDALVFSGGIGEASPELRNDLAEKLQNTPLSMAAAEAPSSGDSIVTRLADESNKLKRGSIPWLVCKTNEEEECARQVVRHLTEAK